MGCIFFLFIVGILSLQGYQLNAKMIAEREAKIKDIIMGLVQNIHADIEKRYKDKASKTLRL